MQCLPKASQKPHGIKVEIRTQVQLCSSKDFFFQKLVFWTCRSANSLERDWLPGDDIQFSTEKMCTKILSQCMCPFLSEAHLSLCCVNTLCCTRKKEYRQKKSGQMDVLTRLAARGDLNMENDLDWKSFGEGRMMHEHLFLECCPHLTEAKWFIYKIHLFFAEVCRQKRYTLFKMFVCEQQKIFWH